MPNISVTRGVQSNATSPNPFAARGDQLGGVMMSHLLPDYYEQANLGNVYTSYVTAVALSAPATATIGNLIWNPPGSGVKLVMLGWTSQIVATSASCTGVAIAGGFQTSAPTTVTAATSVGNTLVTATTRQMGTSQTIANKIATVLTAPVIIEVLHHNTAAINTVGMEMMRGEFKGGIVVAPGGFVTLVALGGAAAASGHTSSLTWMEVPVLA